MGAETLATSARPTVAEEAWHPSSLAISSQTKFLKYEFRTSHRRARIEATQKAISNQGTNLLAVQLPFLASEHKGEESTGEEDDEIAFSGTAWRKTCTFVGGGKEASSVACVFNFHGAF